MFKWQGIEFRILKLKLHSCTVYRVVGAGIGGWQDISFCMLFKGLDPIKEARPLLVLHGNRGVTTAVYHPNSIPIRLNTIRHESFELGLRNTVPCHNIIEVLPKYHLSSSIF
jgi:hypothetical protein